MLSNTEVRTAGNEGLDAINTDVRLESGETDVGVSTEGGLLKTLSPLDIDCVPIYPFRFWCLPDKDQVNAPLDDGFLKIDTQTDVGLDVYTNAENPDLIPDVL